MLGAWYVSVNRILCLYVAYRLKIPMNLIPWTKKKKKGKETSVVSSLSSARNMFRPPYPGTNLS